MKIITHKENFTHAMPGMSKHTWPAHLVVQQCLLRVTLIPESMDSSEIAIW